MNESILCSLIRFWQRSSCFISDSINWWEHADDFDGLGPWLVEYSDDNIFGRIGWGSKGDLEVHSRDDLFFDRNNVTKLVSCFSLIEKSGSSFDFLERSTFFNSLKFFSIDSVITSRDLNL